MKEPCTALRMGAGAQDYHPMEKRASHMALATSSAAAYVCLEFITARLSLYICALTYLVVYTSRTVPGKQRVLHIC